MFSISDDDLASCIEIVFISIKGFGSLAISTFTEDKAREADTSFLRMSLSFSNSLAGGSKGKLLKGLFRSKI